MPLSRQNWLGERQVTLYQNAPDNLAAVTGDEESASMLYGAVSEASYHKLDTAPLEGIGDPMQNTDCSHSQNQMGRRFPSKESGAPFQLESALVSVAFGYSCV